MATFKSFQFRQLCHITFLFGYKSMNMAWSRKSEKSKDHRNTEQEYHTVVIYRYSDYIENMIYIYIYYEYLVNTFFLYFRNSYYIPIHQINFNWS